MHPLSYSPVLRISHKWIGIFLSAGPRDWFLPLNIWISRDICDVIRTSTFSLLNNTPSHEYSTFCPLVDQLVEARSCPYVLKCVNTVPSKAGICSQLLVIKPSVLSLPF